MVKPKTTKKRKVPLSTYERLTQDPVRKAKLEKEFKELLLEEFKIASAEGDLAAMKKLATALKKWKFSDYNVNGLGVKKH